MKTFVDLPGRVESLPAAGRGNRIFQIGRQMTRNPATILGAVFLLAIVAWGLLAPLIAPYDPLEVDSVNTLQPPGARHWFGTDDTGRDVYSRVNWGARISIRVGLISSAISIVIGLTLGLISGYYEGPFGFLILRFMDLLLAFPDILLALMIVATLGAGLDNVMIAVGVAAVPTFARVVYGSVLSAKQEEYVEAARVIGCGDLRIILRHVAPAILPPVIVLATLQVAAAIFAASSLSFIGLGAQPPTPEWGAMVSRGRYALRSAWWMSTFPGLAIALVVVAINAVGDGLRDALDPRMRGR